MKVRVVFSAFLGLMVATSLVGSVKGQTDCQTLAPADAQHFSGDTATVTDPFVVQSGILTVTGTHQGDANFIVEAITDVGEQHFLFNEIGPYTGQTSLQVAPGSKLILDVKANGPWTLDIAPAF